MAKTKPAEYRCIWAWGMRLGSYPDYIEREQEKAAAAGAPVDSIYQERGGGRWVSVHECNSLYTRNETLRVAGITPAERSEWSEAAGRWIDVPATKGAE